MYANPPTPPEKFICKPRGASQKICRKVFCFPIK